ncbi:MAG: methyl-accepting chemotaxis protein [Clostridia bacterium]|nr:methyl-accepting chemotaxis protein [Clostridia bacterium]
MKLKSKLLFLLIGLIIIPLIVGIAFTYLNIKSSISDIELAKAKSNVSSARQYINLLVENHGSTYLAWTPWDEFYDAVGLRDTAWIEENVFTSANKDTANEFFVVLDKDANILTQAEAPSEFKEIDYKNFGLLKDMKKGYNSGIVKTSAGLYIVTVAKLVKSDDEAFANHNGYTLFAREIKNLREENGRSVSGSLDFGKNIMGTEIIIKLDDGKVLSTSKIDKANLSNTISKDLKKDEIKTYTQILKDSMKITAEQAFTDYSGTPVGVLYVETVSKSGVAALGQLSRHSVILVVILMISVVLVSFIIINNIIKPLKLIVSEAQKIAAGDLTTSSEAALVYSKLTKSKDEIGEFARAFEVMKSSLRLMISSVLDSVSKVARTSEMLSVVAQQTGEASDQVAKAVDEMAEGANKQSDYSNTILHMMEDTLVQVQKGSEEIEKTVTNALLSTKVAYDGKEAITKAVEHVKLTAETVSSSSESIQKLGVRSEEIGGIVKAITDIASHTNLLALNAAIEAARAGEEGKGFSVVAEQIRKLAEESSQEAKQIKSLVQQIQAETSATVDNMEGSLKAVEEQVEMMQKGGDSLMVIVDNVEQTENDSKKIKVVFDTLREYTQNVLLNIKEISNIISESAAATEQVSASVEEQASTVNEIADSSVKLAQLASNLQSEVSRFKL